MRFELKTLIPVHRDPIGHYHHWSIMVGELHEGSMDVGDFVELPVCDGLARCSGIVGGFEAQRRIFNSTLSHEAVQGVDVGVMVRSPAPSNAVVCAGDVRLIDQALHLELVQIALKTEPERFFHNRGPHGADWQCPECYGILRRVPHVDEVTEILERHARDHEDAQVCAWISAYLDV